MSRNGGKLGGVSKLDASVIRRISTGQVVLNIAAACKELIENALDAGATAIDIRVLNYGVTSLEVCDNGIGIREPDFENLAKAHYTSKLSNFDELGSLKTYGFRGEALNALSAMSKLTIVTRHGTVGTATKLEFDATGVVKSKSPCARTVGTTVTVERFLEPLPVRRKEFEKNARNEYQKILNVVQAYCLILRNVRIDLSHRLDSGQKKMVLSTYPNHTTRENICNVFGADQLKSLIDFVQVTPLKEQLSENGFFDESILKQFAIEGLVSTIEKGAGRNSADRQFIFINQRPCDFAKVLKGINEIYRQYNRQQYPVVILNIKTKGKVDVNVTPDKRQVFVANEDLLHFIIKSSLTVLYDKLQGVCKIGEAASVSSFVNSQTILASSTSVLNERPIQAVPKRVHQPNDESASMSKAASGDILVAPPAPKHFKSAAALLNGDSPSGNDTAANGSAFVGAAIGSTPAQHVEELHNHGENIVAPTIERQKRVSGSSNGSSNGGSELSVLQRRQDFDHDASSAYQRPRSSSSASSRSAVGSTPERTCGSKNATLDSWLGKPRERTSSSGSNQSSLAFHRPERRLTVTMGDNDSVDRGSLLDDSESGDEIQQFRPASRIRTSSNEERRKNRKAKTVSLLLETPWAGYRKSADVPFSFDALRLYHEAVENRGTKSPEYEDVDEQRFRAKITPEQSKEAELELKLSLEKKDFAAMRVIGQFNRSFIISRLNDDLFVIDQHASDEKYNFEKLERSASFQCQKLLQPLRLEFSPSQEQVVTNRPEVFRKNGFEFISDSAKPPGKRFMLTAIPDTRSCTFDKSDIDEIIAILDDDPTLRMYRPVKLRNIFASKACRMSVMIGKALSNSETETILRHLSEIEQPWNCPHGRPTVRHLFNMRQIPRNLRLDE